MIIEATLITKPNGYPPDTFQGWWQTHGNKTDLFVLEIRILKGVPTSWYKVTIILIFEKVYII